MRKKGLSDSSRSSAWTLGASSRRGRGPFAAVAREMLPKMRGSRRLATPTGRSRSPPSPRGESSPRPIWSISHSAASHDRGSRPERRRTMDPRSVAEPSSTSSPCTRSSRKKTTRRISPDPSAASARCASLSAAAYSLASSGEPNRSSWKPRALSGSAWSVRRSACCRATRLPPRTETSIANASATPPTSKAGRRGCARSLAAATATGAWIWVVDTGSWRLPVFRTTMQRVPRYDIPKAAPEGLRQVQLLINSVDVHNEVEWLPEWLAERGLGAEHERARELREALRSLVLANNGLAPDPAALEVVNRALESVSLALDPAGRLVLRGGGDALDEVVRAMGAAMLDGSWERL